MRSRHQVVCSSSGQFDVRKGGYRLRNQAAGAVGPMYERLEFIFRL